jgi:succinate dehydrogenase / fumarate reductase membrane anchor subunit
MENKPRNFSGTLRWFSQAGLGILLVILLSIHLIVNHLAAPHGLLSHADVVRYYDIPGIALMEIIFLAVVTTHSILGLHSILLDLNLPPTLNNICTWLLVIAGVAAILYGSRLAWLITTMTTP